MANWQLYIDFSDFWDKYPDELSLKELCNKVITVLRSNIDIVAEKLPDHVDMLENIIEDFESLCCENYINEEAFDDIMENLYDWADTNLDNDWNGKKLAWIKP